MAVRLKSSEKLLPNQQKLFRAVADMLGIKEEEQADAQNADKAGPVDEKEEKKDSEIIAEDELFMNMQSRQDEKSDTTTRP